MKKEEILKKAIEKAIKNTSNPSILNAFYIELKDEIEMYEINGLNQYYWIFSHDFAKAFWGEEDIKKEYDEEVDNLEFGGILHYPYDEGACITWKGEKWKYHLQQMVLAEDPLSYLEIFI